MGTLGLGPNLQRYASKNPRFEQKSVDVEEVECSLAPAFCVENRGDLVTARFGKSERLARTGLACVMYDADGYLAKA